jgi:hypothetical protein
MPLKTYITSLCMLSIVQAMAQDQPAGGQSSSKVIEGGKVVVELIRAINGKKDQDRDPGCKNRYADLCIINHSGNSLMVSLLHRQTEETREVVVLPGGRECSLQAKVGVWTYDLKYPGSPLSLRKGDLLIQGCQNLEMTIK